jgi:hypothetical protein
MLKTKNCIFTPCRNLGVFIELDVYSLVEGGRTMYLYKNGVSNISEMMKTVGSSKLKELSCMMWYPILRSLIAVCHTKSMNMLHMVIIEQDHM